MAVQSKVEVETEGARVVPLAVWSVIVLDSGETKSPVFAHMTRPLQVIQRELARTLQDEEADEEPSALQEGEDGADEGESAPEVASALETLQRATREPELVLSDVTHAALVQLLAKQPLGVGMFSPDSGMPDGFMSHVAIGDLNKAFDGESIRPRRVSRSAKPIDRAVVTIGTSLQPTPFRSLFRNRLAFESGFLNRFLVCFPEPKSGQRKAPFTPPALGVIGEYERSVMSLFALPSPRGGRLHRLVASTGAQKVAVRFFNDTEALLGGELRGIRGRLDKLRLYQWRIAALLHLAELVPRLGAEAKEKPITVEAMKRAEAMCRWYIPQAGEAFGLPQIDELADEILEAVHERSAFLRFGFSKRDMLRATKRRAEELAPALERLVEGGTWRRRPSGGRRGTGSSGSASWRRCRERRDVCPRTGHGPRMNRAPRLH